MSAISIEDTVYSDADLEEIQTICGNCNVINTNNTNNLQNISSISNVSNFLDKSNALNRGLLEDKSRLSNISINSQ